MTVFDVLELRSGLTWGVAAKGTVGEGDSPRSMRDVIKRDFH